MEKIEFKRLSSSARRAERRQKRMEKLLENAKRKRSSRVRLFEEAFPAGLEGGSMVQLVFKKRMIKCRKIVLL